MKYILYRDEISCIQTSPTSFSSPEIGDICTQAKMRVSYKDLDFAQEILLYFFIIPKGSNVFGVLSIYFRHDHTLPSLMMALGRL